MARKKSLRFYDQLTHIPQSPRVLSDVDNNRNSIVHITPNDTDRTIVNDNSTKVSHMNRQSSSRITTHKSLRLYEQLIHVPKYVELKNHNLPLHINCWSLSCIATKNSLEFYKQLNNIPKYQELILILNHLTHDDLPYVRLSRIKKDMYTRC